MHSKRPAGDINERRASCVDSSKRREFLSGVAALGVSALAPSIAVAAKQAGDAPRGAGTVDVHHHFFPSFLVEAAAASPAAASSFLTPAVRAWTAQGALRELDLHGVETAVLSGTSFRALFALSGKDATRQMVRRVNEYAAGLTRDFPQRFRFFGYLPMPDVDASLAEIDYALGTLGASGVGVFTSYGDQWIGDPRFWPVLEELNRRRSVVFCHPDAPDCCGNLMPNISTAVSGLIEFPYDTGRAVLSLLLSGALARFPDIRWIFCHAGGAIPALAGRIRENATFLVKNLEAVAPNGIDHELRRLHYDIANSAYSPTMAALLDYVPLSQVMFGSDFPYVGVGTNLDNLRGIGLSASIMSAIQHGNARRLLASVSK